MYCIALKNSARVPALKEELARVGLGTAASVLEFERDKQDGKRGCFTSHQKALQMGIEAKAKAIVILEDDVMFRGEKNVGALVDEAVAIAVNKPMSIVALGCLLMGPVGARVPAHPRFKYVPWACTHAYVVSPDMAAEIVALTYEGEHIDKVMKARYAERMIACVPGVAFQRPFYTYADLTLTESTLYYRMLTLGRNLLSPVFVQLVFEIFFRVCGTVRGLF